MMHWTKESCAKVASLHKLQQHTVQLLTCKWECKVASAPQAMSKFKTQQLGVLFPRFSRGFAGSTLQSTHVKIFPPLLHQLLHA
jgi:hypothetical protein